MSWCPIGGIDRDHASNWLGLMARTVMPRRAATAGSKGLGNADRSGPSRVAMSIFVPILNVTFMDISPLFVLLLCMFHRGAAVDLLFNGVATFVRPYGVGAVN